MLWYQKIQIRHSSKNQVNQYFIGPEVDLLRSGLDGAPSTRAHRGGTDIKIKRALLFTGRFSPYEWEVYMISR